MNRQKDMTRRLPCSVLICTANIFRASESREEKKEVINNYIYLKKQATKTRFNSLFNRSEGTAPRTLI